MTEYLFLAAIDADRGDETKEVGVEACEKVGAEECCDVGTFLRAEIRYSAVSCM
jgi:hypothetical protein